MATDQTIIQDFDIAYTEAYYAWDSFYPEAERDLRMFLGDQWDEQEKRKLFEEGRNAFVFNRIRPVINMITGYQRKHRLSSVVTPVEDSDQKTADQLSQLLLYAMNYGDGYRMISDAFGGAMKTGWNLISIWMDYRDDPINGDIKFGREPYNGFITDPYWTKLDWSDCNYIMRRKYLSPEMVSSLLPDMEDEIWDIYRSGWERDDKFTWLPYQRQPNGEDLMAYNEYYLQKWKNVPMIVDMDSGEFMEFDVSKDQQKVMLELYENLKIMDRPKRYIERHIIINDVHMKTDTNPYGLDQYPFAQTVGIWEPESDLWSLKMQSLTRCMRDPQREGNRRRSQMIDMLDSQINSGWIADENSVVNPRSLFQTSQGKVIWKREDAKPDAITKIPPSQIPPSMFQLQELFDKDLKEIVGVNDASFGVAESGNESGVMMMLRQSAALVNLQDVFDNLRFTQKHLSQMVVKLIQTWTPEKVKRIINEDPTQEFYNQEFTKYDISIQEGVLTDTQKQMNFRQMVDIYTLTGGPQGSPITPQMLYEAAPLQGKSDVNEKIEQNQQQAAQQAQQQQQIQQELLQKQSEMAQAKSISDIALSKERFTRSIANMGLHEERNSESIQNRAQASLDRVKTMKELQEMDDDRLIKYMQIVAQMEQASKLEEQKNKSEDVAITEQSEKMNAAFPHTTTQLPGAPAPEQPNL